MRRIAMLGKTNVCFVLSCFLYYCVKTGRKDMFFFGKKARIVQKYLRLFEKKENYGLFVAENDYICSVNM